MEHVKFKVFVDYVNEFYNIDTGIYKIATRNQLQVACVQYIQKMISEGREAEVEYDSIDRERVRQIIQPSYSLI